MLFFGRSECRKGCRIDASSVQERAAANLCQHESPSHQKLSRSETHLQIGYFFLRPPGGREDPVLGSFRGVGHDGVFGPERIIHGQLPLGFNPGALTFTLGGSGRIPPFAISPGRGTRFLSIFFLTPIRGFFPTPIFFGSPSTGSGGT